MAEWSLTHKRYDERLERDGNRTGCGGTFRVEEDGGKGAVVTRCDGCGMLLGVARRVFDAGPPEARSAKPEAMPF